MSLISFSYEKSNIYLTKTHIMFHCHQMWGLVESLLQEQRRATQCHSADPLQHNTTELFFQKWRKRTHRNVFSLQGGNGRGPLWGKTNIVKPPHIKTQTLCSLKRMLDNG